MKYTAAHWGSYEIAGDTMKPLADDPSPSRIGKGWLTATQDVNSRILKPAIRRGWLDGDRGQDRCRDTFVEVEWEQAVSLASQELFRVKGTFGNGAIFGGSYGWSSAGRFHHAQSQLRRFLNLAGGFVGARETYSHAAAEVLFPHILGLSNRAFQDQMTSLPLVAEHCDLLLVFGGITQRTAQIASSGTSRHEIPAWLDTLQTRGIRMINVSPQRSDLVGGDWWAIRPGTDTALLLALTFEIVTAGLADEGFLSTYTSGWDQYRSYLLGQGADQTPKSAEWATAICDIPAQWIRDLATELVRNKSMIAMSWGMQRADHGEQPLWAGIALACVIGQIGKAGTGFAFGYGSTTPVGRPSKLISWPSVSQGRNPVKDYIPVARIADMLMHPGRVYQYNGEQRQYPNIKLVWWVGGNPFHHHQDLNRLERAWKKPETVIVNDHSWTATARRADIIFPATSPLEREDIMINRRDPSLLYMSKMLEPMGEAKNDFEIFSLLSAKLGFEDAFTEGLTETQWLEKLWSGCIDVAQAEGFDLPSYDQFRTTGRFDIPDAEERRVALADFIANPQAHPLNTETGRITLFNQGIADAKLTDCPPHPSWLEPCESLLSADSDALHLISGQPDTRLHSQNDRGSEALDDKICGREPAYLHPKTAGQYDLREGDIIRLFNKRGACLAGLRLSEAIRPDCIALATGAWFDPQIVEGQALEVHGNPNVLTKDIGCSSLSQGNIAHTALVWIEKWQGELPVLTVHEPPVLKHNWE